DDGRHPAGDRLGRRRADLRLHLRRGSGRRRARPDDRLRARGPALPDRLHRRDEPRRARDVRPPEERPRRAARPGRAAPRAARPPGVVGPATRVPSDTDLLGWLLALAPLADIAWHAAAMPGTVVLGALLPALAYLGLLLWIAHGLRVGL